MSVSFNANFPQLSKRNTRRDTPPQELSLRFVSGEQEPPSAVVFDAPVAHLHRPVSREARALPFGYFSLCLRG
jgi:hypothetical protein